MADEEESRLPAMVAKITLAPIDASQVLASVEAIRTKFNAETFNINVAVSSASLATITQQVQAAVDGAGSFSAGAGGGSGVSVQASDLAAMFADMTDDEVPF